jgi:hypothetical protein
MSVIAMLLDDSRVAKREAAKLAKEQGYGRYLTRALIRKAGELAAQGQPPRNAARSVVRSAEQSATDPVRA